MEYSIKPKRLGERGIIHYPQKRIIGLYEKEMFGKKKEQKIETGGVTYRRAKTWQIALASCSSGIGMSFYVLLGLASYVAN